MDNQAKDLCRSKDSLNTNKPTCTFQQYGRFLVNTRMGPAEYICQRALMLMLVVCIATRYPLLPCFNTWLLLLSCEVRRVSEWGAVGIDNDLCPN